jgi:hypothetical protein
MRIVAALFMLGLSLPALSREVRLTHMRPQLQVHLQSHGEPSASLIDLLSPFLATHGFEEAQRHAKVSTRTEVAVFVPTSDHEWDEASDAVAMKGTFSNLTVTYCTWFYPWESNDLKGAGRATELLADLRAFLHSLPAPNIQVSDSKVDSSQSCSNAF